MRVGSVSYNVNYSIKVKNIMKIATYIKHIYSIHKLRIRTILKRILTDTESEKRS